MDIRFNKSKIIIYLYRFSKNTSYNFFYTKDKCIHFYFNENKNIIDCLQYIQNLI